MGLREGEITKDTYKKLLEFSGGKLTPTIYFDSPGGSLIGGIQLGETIRKLGLATGTEGLFHLASKGLVN